MLVDAVVATVAAVVVTRPDLALPLAGTALLGQTVLVVRVDRGGELRGVVEPRLALRKLDQVSRYHSDRRRHAQHELVRRRGCHRHLARRERKEGAVRCGQKGVDLLLGSDVLVA